MKINLLLAALIFSNLITSAQRFEWLEHSNQMIANQNVPVAVDPSGNSYTLIGCDPSGVIIGIDTFPCLTTGSQGVLIAKFDATGKLLWGKMVNPDAGILNGEKIAVDNAGSVYASINFPNGGSVHLIDTVYLSTPVGEGGVIIKLSSSGSFKRSVTFDYSAAPRISCLGTDLYIGYQNTIAKYDSAFKKVWSLNDPTNTLEFDFSAFSRADIFVQTNGELITSAYEYANTIGAVPFGNDTVHFTAGGNDEVAVIKLDTAGHVLWSKALDFGSPPDVRAVCLDHHGNAYLGLWNAYDQFIFANDTLINTLGAGDYCAILKWDSAGNPINAIGLYPVISIPTLYDLNVNAQNDLLVSGHSGTGDISIENDTLIPSFNAAYLFKFDSSGTFVWSPPTVSSAYADGIAVTASNKYIWAGSTFNAGTFRIGCLAYNSSAPTNFIAEISDQSEIYPLASFTYTSSSPLTFSFQDQSNNATSWFWTFGDGDSSTVQNPVHTYVVGGIYVVVLTAYHNACSSIDSLIILNVGVDNLAFRTSFSIYPNPSTGVITLKSAKKVEETELKIYNMLGLEVAFETVNLISNDSEKTITLKNASPGVYLLEINSDKERYAQKFVVE